MATLPYSRVVNVTLTKLDGYPTRTGFGVPLIISEAVSDVTAGAVDGTTLTKVYGSIDEVADDWGPTTGAYLAAASMFAQNPRPPQVKIGYIDDALSTTIAADLTTLKDYDDGWYWMVPTTTGDWHDDSAYATVFANWANSQTKLMFLSSEDADTENSANTTNVAHIVETLNTDRTAVFYHDTAGTQLAAAAAAYGATRNFDDAASAYTFKFTPLSGIPIVDKASSAIQAVTGFVPGLGVDTDEGHSANTYIDIGGTDFLVEGQICSISEGFIDEVHFQDWLIARTQEEVLALFVNEAVVPYTDKGFDMVAQCVQRVLGRAANAGLIAEYEDTDGNIVPWEISVPRVASVAASQRRQRIMPALTAKFRYAGAVHYSTINYEMAF